jgi:hypothetical protein
MRLSLQIPLTVRCQLPEGEAIDLKASTHCVGANGGLLVMDAPMMPGQTVRIINEMTNEKADCVVTSVRKKHEKMFVGIGFADPGKDFWHIVFPRAGTRQSIRSAQTGALQRPTGRAENPQQF